MHINDRPSSDAEAHQGLFDEIHVPLLKSVLWMILAIAVLFVGIVLESQPDHRWRVVFPICVAIVVLGARAVLRYRGGVPAVRLLALGGWLLTTAAAVTGEGVRTPVLLIYPTLLIFSGWILGARYSIGLFIASSAAVLLMAFGDHAGYLARVDRTPLVVVTSVHLFVLGVSSVLTWYLLRVFRQREADKRRLASEVEASLRVAEKNADELRMLAEHIPALVFEIDCEGGIVFANRSFAAFFAVRQEQLQRASVAAIIGFDLANTLPQMRNPEGPSQHVEFNIRRQAEGGAWHSFDVTMVPRHAADSKQTTGWYGLMHDVTKREEAAVELLEHATHDRLTDAWNRRKFEEVAAAELQRAARYGSPVSMMLLDIDHFKAINDTHGHLAGDRVLRGIADRVREAMRGSDSLTRWGGEEFIVLAPGTALPDAHILAERICEHVAQRGFGEVGRVTISVGVADYMPAESFEGWLNRVDHAMYEAKQLGRNRVRSHAARVPAHGALEGEPGTFVKLVWKSAFVSGNQRIDEQHLHLFQLSNELLDAVLSRQPPYAIPAAIDRLLEAIEQHFADEEAVLRGLGFARLPEHAGDHAALMAKGRDLADAFRAGEVSIGALFQFLTYDLVAMHILCADREYFDLTLLNMPSDRAST